jgi:hypothetical protein
VQRTASDLISGPSSRSLPRSSLGAGCWTHCQGSSTPFHHKEKVAIKSFNARIVALFLSLFPPDTIDNGKEEINDWIIGTDIRRANQISLTGARFLETVNSIRNEVFFRATTVKDEDTSILLIYERKETIIHEVGGKNLTTTMYHCS